MAHHSADAGAASTDTAAPTHTHTETSSLLHSHHSPAPPSYSSHQHHHHDQQHHHHKNHNDPGHHGHHHDHRHRHDDSPEPPIEVVQTPMPWPQQQNCAACRNEPTAAEGFAVVFQQILAAVVFLFIIGWFIFIASHIGDTPSAGGPWHHMSISNKVDTVRTGRISSIDDRVSAVLSSTPLIDGHNDLAIYLRAYYKNNITSHDFRSGFEHKGLSENVDLPRLRSGQNGGAFWSAFVTCPPNASYDMSNANYANATAETLEQIDLLRRLQAQYPRDFTPAVPTILDASGREHMILQWHATRSLFGPISIEGLHQIPPTSPFSTLRLYYTLGVRMATLTWNCHNPFADASLLSDTSNWTAPPTVVNSIFRPNEGAVTNKGKKLLKEMNRLGMIIDISHTSYWTQKAVLSPDKHGNRITRAPVVFSHSSAYTLCSHPRNVRDDILDLVAKSNSLVMVNFSPDFISCTPPSSLSSEPHFSLPDFYAKNNTLHQVARHIVYIGDRIGYSHVGLGSDFDGMGPQHPEGLGGVDKYPDLVAELLRMGIRDEDARKVVGGNLLRVWKEVDGVAKQMEVEGVEPAVDEVTFL